MNVLPASPPQELAIKPVYIAAAPHPFRVETINTSCPEGLTLAEILELVQADEILRAHAHIFINGEHIAREFWHVVRPKAGAHVAVRVVPMGGKGKNPLRTILMIAVIAASFYFGGAVGGALGIGKAGVTIGSVTLSAAQIGGAVISLVGNLLINVIAPPPVPSLGGGGTITQDSPTKSLSGARNGVRQFAPLPAVLGTHKIVPPLAALPFTEIVGDDQFFRMIVCWNLFHGELTNLKIGETGIGSFTDVTIEHRGQLGQAIVFAQPSPANQSITLPSLNLDGAFSIEAKVKTTASARQTILSNRSGGGAGVWLGMTAGGLLEFVDTSGTPSTVTATTPVNDGLEHHIAAVVTGGVCKLYVDRVEEASLVLIARVGQNNPGQIATDLNSGEWFNGSLDDVRVWNLARAAGDIDREINGLEGGLLGWWEFDDSDARDYSVAGADGILNDASPAGITYETGMSYTNYPHKLYTDTVIESALNIQLFGETGSPPATPGDWHVRTTGIDADEISIDIVFRSGLVKFKDSGDKLDYTVNFSIEYADASVSPRAWIPQSTFDVTAAQTNAVRKGVAWSVTRGQYDVRVRRNTEDDDGTRILDDSFWSAIRTIRNVHPITEIGLMTTAIKIKATDQLSGVLDSLNALVSSHHIYWDSGISKWVRGKNSNPATAFREVAEGKGNKRALLSGRVGLADLQTWAENNEAAGREFNQVVDFSSSVGNMLRNIAAVGRASVSRKDGVWSIIEDFEQTIPIQHFTPSNSWNFRGEKVFADFPHALKIRFLNKEQEYLQDERIIYDDGFDATNATKFEALTFDGVVDPAMIWKDGRFHIAQARLRPEVYSLHADVEHIVATRGSLCLVQHDVTLWGIASGRIKSVADDGGTPPNAIAVTVENVCAMEAGKSYNIRFRLSDGGTLLKNVDLNVGENFTLTFATPFPLNDAPRDGDLFMFGEAGTETQELILTDVEPLTDLAARLVFVDHSPAVYSADTGGIPTFDSNITVPLGLIVPGILNLRSDESVLIKQPNGSLTVRILATYQRAAGLGGGVIGVEASWRRTGSDGPYEITPMSPIDAGNVSIFAVDEGAQYDVRLRYVKNDNVRGPWSSVVSHTVIGTTLPPPDLDTFIVDTLADGTRRFVFGYDLGAPLDVVGFQIRTDISAPSPPDWDVMDRLHPEGVLTASPYETNELAAGFYTFAIKAIDINGFESENALFIVATLGDPRIKDVLIQRLEHVIGFDGTKVDCHVGFAGVLRANDDAGDWASLSGTTWAALSTKTWETITPRKTTIVYTTPIMDVGIDLDFTPLVTVTATGIATITMRTGTDADGAPVGSFVAVADVTGKRYIEIKVSVTEGTAPNITQMVTLLDGETITEKFPDVNTATESATWFNLIAAGHFEIGSKTGNLAAISQARIVALQNVGAGWTWELISKTKTVGGEVAAEFKIYNSSDTLANATVDVELSGAKKAV